MVAVIWLPEMSELDDVTTRVHAWYICCEKRERLLFRIRMTQLSSTYIAKSRYQKSSQFSVENLKNENTMTREPIKIKKDKSYQGVIHS